MKCWTEREREKTKGLKILFLREREDKGPEHIIPQREREREDKGPENIIPHRERERRQRA